MHWIEILRLLGKKKIVRDNIKLLKIVEKLLKNVVKLLKNVVSVVPPGHLDTAVHSIMIVIDIYIKKKEDPAVLLKHSWAFLIASLLDKKKVV